jgi:hypothetical protein
MTTSDNPRRLQRILVPVAHGAAAVAGLKYGYDFGAEISGKLLGIVLAINGAVFCSIVVGMVVDRARQVLGRRTTNRDAP